MGIYYFDNLIDRDFRNLLNEMGKAVEAQGKTIQDLVAEGQLTVEQYAELLEIINGMIKKGEVTVYDIDKNKGKFDETYLTDELLQQIAGNAPIHSVPAEDSITINQIAFTKKSSNLYDDETRIDGYYLGTDGTLIANEELVTSSFISSNSLQSYFVKKARRILYYDSDKTVIGYDPDLNAKFDYVFTTPDNTSYIRLSWAYSDLPSSPQQLNAGTVELPYEPYYKLIDRRYVEKQEITSDDIPDGAINPHKTSFMKPGKNIFDKENIIKGYYVNYTNGNLVESASYNTSEDIEVIQFNNYVPNISIRMLAFFDGGNNYISGNQFLNPGDIINAPENAKYLKVSFNAGDEEYLQIEEGTTVTAYEPFGYYIDNLLINNSSGDNRVKVLLPPTIYGVTGMENNIYFQNIVNVKDTLLDFNVEGSEGKHMSKKWTDTPTNPSNSNLIISANKDFKVLASTTVNLVVKEPLGTGSTNLLVIGDSTVNAGGLTQRILDNFADDPVTMTLLGTRGDAPNLHEGRGGWTVERYRTDDMYDGVVNPFYNPSVMDFDFSYYASNQGYSVVNNVMFVLGINDTFNSFSDVEVDTKIDNILTSYDFLIQSIHTFDPNVRVGVSITIPPNASQDAFGNAYGNNQTQWRYKRNNAIWIERIIEHFKNKEAQNIYLVPMNHNIDTENNIADGVHPNTNGYNQMGDSTYFWLKSFDS
ncbi:SGNH/GDSL hydrolase family protein [Gracilibacillus dipsosauri]|uniref:SGNH hydrolase-type esterase domain-containing protein n=1 Tax=Gracilibacillus dipsosauri TaxID=178340 RepID=A0A317KTE2_9BACI|nr:SGNH/GDSL hydrolase family protein [Gracilibacillus dipsosauri]PWU66586.1 hypothetical protein DLJ74_19385 [Gracilibacillus dipsosauri]